MQKEFVASLIVAFAALFSGAAHSQAYPVKPITLVVPYAAGGTAEVMGRVFAQHLGDVLGQTVIIDIKAGAGSMIGSEYVAKLAKPDGYTILLGANPLAINVAVKKLAFDPQKDLVPVGGVAGFSSVLVTSATSPYQSVADLIKAGKTENLTFGSSGPGSVSHMAGELFKSLANVNMTHVPYKGSGPVYPDMIAGRVSVLFDVSASAIGFINGGKVRALAVTSTTRSRALPNVPSLAEAGVAGYEALTWFGVFAPAGTPPAIVARLDQALRDVSQNPAFVARLDQWGGAPLAMASADEFTRYFKADVLRWEGLVRDGKMKRLD
ncbi:tripartite tricarboxylate transporter substrate binding protein [Lacisediminimonas sp.]|uniref:Bug family tripartite tricarboxylate transporter substrate binding protein n=1 Tax=Lacisediminimonas sp. TaxID=3060582 RepID=UPI00271F599D|nr:tripartite tricarboxylate transporter substrate binding protein [Lacisediminimonas sp.]MDO8299852.1 tripartite tricarboxylate transporter substrate binding protein [Lacisediminimonas sp.]